MAVEEKTAKGMNHLPLEGNVRGGSRGGRTGEEAYKVEMPGAMLFVR